MPRTSDRDREHVRLLTAADQPLLERLLYTSDYIYQRFTQDELSMLLRHYPTIGLFNGSSQGASLRSFLLSQTVNPPTAWIGGFGVSWTESRVYLRLLYRLLDEITPHLLTRGVRYLHYSGN